MSATTEGQNTTASNVEQLESATVRLAGDSGDGMQLFGTQLTNTSALAGNDVATFPDFPAEIRAPRGTRAGVSGFQVQFAASEIFTPGDRLDTLVAMNPAALVTNIADLKRPLERRGNARRRAPPAPTAAASVGVAMPV